MWRHRGRSFFIIFSVCLAVSVAVWVMAIFDGINRQIELAVVQNNIGHYQLQEKNFGTFSDPSTPASISPDFFAKLAKAKVVHYSPELTLDGFISLPEGQTQIEIIGVHPKLHLNTFSIGKTLSAGRFLEENDEGIFIGKEAADMFGLNLDDQLLVNFQDNLGNIKSELLPVIGIFNQNGKLFERTHGYISISKWKKLYQLGQDQTQLYHRIVITDKNISRLSLERLSPNSFPVVKHWKDLNPEMAVVLEFHDGMIRLFFIIIGITIIMTVLNPVLILWQERNKELRTLFILGASKKHFWKIALSESGLMTMLASLSSLVFLCVLIGYQSLNGLNFSFLHQGRAVERAGIELPRLIFPLLSWKSFVIVFVFVSFVMMFSFSLGLLRILRRIKNHGF